jgi:hypothetical protein
VGRRKYEIEIVIFVVSKQPAMKKMLLLGLLFFAACKMQNHIIELTEKVGCWYEPATKKEICGAVEAFNKKDSVYTMRTFEPDGKLGWAMKVKASEIQWQ